MYFKTLLFLIVTYNGNKIERLNLLKSEIKEKSKKIDLFQTYFIHELLVDKVH